MVRVRSIAARPTAPAIVARLVAVLSVMSMATLTTSGCASSDAGEGNDDPPRVVEITAVEYDFLTERPPDITVGETITFVLTNAGAMAHELQLLDDQGRRLAMIDAIAPGGTGRATHRFDRAGLYQVICDLDDHLSRGQRKVFQVTG